MTGGQGWGHEDGGTSIIAITGWGAAEEHTATCTGAHAAGAHGTRSPSPSMSGHGWGAWVGGMGEGMQVQRGACKCGGTWVGGIHACAVHALGAGPYLAIAIEEGQGLTGTLYIVQEPYNLQCLRPGLVEHLQNTRCDARAPGEGRCQQSGL